MAAPQHFDRAELDAENVRARAAIEAAYADAPPMDRAIILASMKILETAVEFIVTCKEIGAPHEMVAAYLGNALGEVAGCIGDNYRCGCVIPRIVNGFHEQIKRHGEKENEIVSFDVMARQAGRA